MKTFTTLPKVGPGIKLYAKKRGQGQEAMYRTTTGEYVIEINDNQKSRSKTKVIDEAKAIQWCINSGACQSESYFFEMLWTAISADSHAGEHKFTQVPLLKSNVNFKRFLELLQLPAFREALVRLPNCNRLERMQLDNLDYLELSSWTNALMSIESFYFNTKISIGPSGFFSRIDSKSNCHEYRVIWESQSFRAKCGYALAPFQFPPKFQPYAPIQGVWIDLVSFEGVFDASFLSRIAESAYGLLFSAILSFEMVESVSEDPTQLPPNNGILER